MKRLVEDFRGFRFIAAAALAVAALFAVAACGGGGSTGGDGTNASAPAITKAELIKRADAICRRTDAAQRSAFNIYSEKHKVFLGINPRMEKAMTTILLPPVGREIEEIAAVGVPPGDESRLSAILAGWEKALKEAVSKPRILLTSEEGPFAKPNKLAGEYGFKVCDNVL